MKVLFVDQIAVVNYKYSFSLVNALKRQGNDVEIVIDDKKDNEYCRVKYYNEFLTSSKTVSKVQKLLNYCSSYKFLVDKAINEHFDIVHVEWFQFSPIDYQYLKKLKKHGIKLVVTIHDILPFNTKFYDKHYHQKIYGMADQIIVQAQTNVKRFDELFPEDSKKVTFIPHGHFLDFADLHDKIESRNHLGIPVDKKVFLFFGQIKKVKGVGNLLEAFGELCQKRDDLYLVIAGSVWKDSFEEYQKIIDEYHLDSKHLKTDIMFIPDEEVGYYYSAADIAVLPYLDVYQSGVIQLTYAYSKPAVATAIAPFMEIVEDGKSGFICKPNNSDDLARVMDQAANVDDQTLEEMAAEGRVTIEKKYSWNDIAKNITELYHK